MGQIIETEKVSLGVCVYAHTIYTLSFLTISLKESSQKILFMYTFAIA